MTVSNEIPQTSRPRTWRAKVFVTASDRRLRLPRDLIGGAVAAVVAIVAWASLAAGVGAPVTLVIPMWISWMVTGVAICGTGVFVIVALLLCAVDRRWVLVGHVVVAAGGAGLTAWAVWHWLGQGAAAAPPLIAASFATAFLVIRILGVPLRTPLWIVVYVGALAQMFGAHLVPLGTIGAAALGIAVGAAVAFGFGTLDVAPTVVEAIGFLDQLGVVADDLVRNDTVATWGATRFSGTTDDAVLDVDIYGRDAPEGQLLSRAWRFMWIRRSTLDLRLRRSDHIEHAAGLMLWARAQGVGAPAVVPGRTRRAHRRCRARDRTPESASGWPNLLPATSMPQTLLRCGWRSTALPERASSSGPSAPRPWSSAPTTRSPFSSFASAESMATVEDRARRCGITARGHGCGGRP